jgi:hypothetical protein
MHVDSHLLYGQLSHQALPSNLPPLAVHPTMNIFRPTCDQHSDQDNNFIWAAFLWWSSLRVLRRMRMKSLREVPKTPATLMHTIWSNCIERMASRHRIPSRHHVAKSCFRVQGHDISWTIVFMPGWKSTTLFSCSFSGVSSSTVSFSSTAINNGCTTPDISHPISEHYSIGVRSTYTKPYLKTPIINPKTFYP